MVIWTELWEDGSEESIPLACCGSFLIDWIFHRLNLSSELVIQFRCYDFANGLNGAELNLWKYCNWLFILSFPKDWILRIKCGSECSSSGNWYALASKWNFSLNEVKNRESLFVNHISKEMIGPKHLITNRAMIHFLLDFPNRGT